MKTSEKILKIPVRNVEIDYSKINASELEILKTKYKLITKITNQTSGANKTYYTLFKTVTAAGPLQYKSGQNLIGLVVFSIAVGLVTAALGEEGKAFLRVVDTLNKIISKLVQYVMW